MFWSWTTPSRPRKSASSTRTRPACCRSAAEILLDNTDAGGVIRIRSANGQVTIAAGEKISVHCTRGDVEVIADTGAVTVTAVNVNVTAKAAMSLKSTTQLEIESAGPVTIKGAIVKIN